MKITKVLNEDGTEYNPPETEEYKKLKELFPSCGYEGLSYSCMYCSKCYFGDNFKWPEQYKHIVEDNRRLRREYEQAHNKNGVLFGLHFEIEY